jgi:molybdenum cofactor biosynthesis enzyme MoaA
MVAKALASSRQPVLAQILATRRCNLSCSYCNEFDNVSTPVPLEKMRARIDRLAALGTAMVDISGGEPLLHPDLDAIIRQIRDSGMMKMSSSASKASATSNATGMPRERQHDNIDRPA